MNAEQLLEHYDKVADAPDAVARLRKFVMELAVRGKLVEQDPSDAPASDLLRKIAAHKHQALSRKPNRWGLIETLSRELAPFELPIGWECANFGDIVVSRDGERIPVSKEERTGRAKVYDYYGASGIIDKIDTFIFDKPLLLIGEDGANLINRSTPIAFIARGKYWVNNHAHVLDGLSEEFLQYIELVINTTDLKPYVTGAAQPKMNQAKMNSIPVALPPLREQERILAKVDELMTLCDRLESARAAREETRDRLAAGSFARLNAPDPNTFRADARFTLSVLPDLTARADQIKQLRQTILNLAVRGKLVAQDPNELPVGLPSAGDHSNRDTLPTGWSNVSLADVLSEDTRNGYARKPDDAANGTPILRISAGTVRVDGVVAEEEHKLIGGIDAKTREQYSLRKGDLVACRFNGNKSFVGKFTHFTDYLGIQPIYPDKLIRVRVSPSFAVAAFIRIAGDSDLVRGQIEALCATTVGNWGISASNLKDVRFPIPPLNEQARIVARVDELMLLCSQLEAGAAASDKMRARLLSSLLESVSRSARQYSSAPRTGASAAVICHGSELSVMDT